MRVLQVEDDPSAAQAVEQMLKAKGYTCETTAYGEEALVMAQHTAYDIILLDIMLPDIDGYEVLRRLQTAQIKTPVLVQSGHIGPEDLAKTVGASVQDYLVKPFTKNELTERIETAVESDRQDGEDAAPASEDDFERRDDPRDDEDIRREHPRHRTLKSGKIAYHNASCVAECLIVNISDGGAALQATDIVDFPDTVQLHVKRGETYDCEVCWQHGKNLGVRFIKT